MVWSDIETYSPFFIRTRSDNPHKLDVLLFLKLKIAAVRSPRTTDTAEQIRNDVTVRLVPIIELNISFLL